MMAYGATKAEADAKVKALALRVIADRFENGEQLPREIAAFLKLHDSLAIGKGITCPCCFVAPRLDRQKTNGITPGFAATGIA
jgi:hypothetical protein